jgi:transcriptional regulator NrdR family protein
LICPNCESKTQRCQETRTFHDPNRNFYYTERRRKCVDCEHLYKTIEVPMEVWAQEANND